MPRSFRVYFVEHPDGKRTGYLVRRIGGFFAPPPILAVGQTDEHVRLTVEPEARARLAELGWHPTHGARPLKRVIEDKVVTPIAVELARHPELRRVRFVVRAPHGQVEVTRA